MTDRQLLPALLGYAIRGSQGYCYRNLEANAGVSTTASLFVAGQGSVSRKSSC